MITVTHRGTKLLNFQSARSSCHTLRSSSAQLLVNFVERHARLQENGTNRCWVPYRFAAGATLSPSLRLIRQARPVQPEAPPEETE